MKPICWRIGLNVINDIKGTFHNFPKAFFFYRLQTSKLDRQWQEGWLRTIPAHRWAASALHNSLLYKHNLHPCQSFSLLGRHCRRSSCLRGIITRLWEPTDLLQDSVKTWKNKIHSTESCLFFLLRGVTSCHEPYFTPNLFFPHSN